MVVTRAATKPSRNDRVEFCPKLEIKLLQPLADPPVQQKWESGSEDVRIGDKRRWRQGGQVSEEKQCLGRVGSEVAQDCVNVETVKQDKESQWYKSKVRKEQ